MSASMPMPVSAQLAMQSLKSAKASSLTGNAPQTPDSIKKSAKEFEGMFMSEMLSHMFEGVKTDPMFGGGKGEEMFRSMLVQEYGKMMTKGQGIGISSQVEATMLKIQEQQQKG